MPDQDKKVKKTDKTSEKKAKDSVERETSDLRRLLDLLSAPASKQQFPSVNYGKTRTSVTKSYHQTTLSRSSASQKRNLNKHFTEGEELENFSVTYRNERKFSSHPTAKTVSENLHSAGATGRQTTGQKDKLVKRQLGEKITLRHPLPVREWVNQSQPDNLLCVLICLRLLMREPLYQKVFHELEGVHCLAQYMETVTNRYLESGEELFLVERLVNITYIFQKLAAAEDQRAWIIESGAHKTLIKLLAATDNNVLLGSLLALTSLAESHVCKEKIGELAVVENLLMILQEYDMLSKRMAAELLRLLCADHQVREQIMIYEGIPILLSLLHSEHLKLVWSVVWILVQLCEDPESSTEIRIWGGIKQLLHILQGDRDFVSDRSSISSLSSANAAGRIQQQHISAELTPQEIQENTVSLQAACCAALTELVLNDTNAHQVVQENGIYIIGKLILPHKQKSLPKEELLQCYAFRALRFLFSMERNRHLFKRLFSTEMFEMFIDIGHYVRDIAAYEKLVAAFHSLSDDELYQIKENIEAVNQNKTPTKIINGYAILDHLGSGAFGSVHKVRKQGGQNLFALKEVNLHNPAFGKDKKDRDSSVEKIVSELTIIKEQLNHPNIVRYYKTFLENDRLFIVMELIEGTPLGENFNSLKEKQQQFTEERIWSIFIQICLALRYLHKEKRIVHRDLTPNNIMLGERDKVTITDFGLAKQKQENSKLMSVVGTILYTCPEIVKNEPYGEKADVWAVGCILYQMVTLNPPFYSSNMLSLATKIVEAVYEPVPEDVYSKKVTDIITWCLTPDPDLRPDIVEVSARISDVIMKYVDGLGSTQISMERKLERERKRTQKYFLEAKRSALSFRHQFSLFSEGQCDNSSSLNKSGASSLRVDSESHEGPSYIFQSTTVKDGDVKVNEKDVSEDNCSLEVTEKDVGSDEDLDMSDTSNSSSKDQTLRSIKRSISASETETQRYTRTKDLSVSNIKPRPASAGISVSQKKVRQISDPIQMILLQLHKVIYITQLPPALHQDFRRRAIERYKKLLFCPQSNPYQLKVEMKRWVNILQGSPELIEPIFLNTDYRFLCQSIGGNSVIPEDRTGGCTGVDYQEGVTYEQMQTMIEEVLQANGYYNAMSCRNLSSPWGSRGLPATKR